MTDPTVGASLVERVLCVSHTCACIEKKFVHLLMRRQTDNRNYKMGYFNFIDYYRHKYALHKAKLHTCASGGQNLWFNKLNFIAQDWLMQAKYNYKYIW